MASGFVSQPIIFLFIFFSKFVEKGNSPGMRNSPGMSHKPREYYVNGNEIFLNRIRHIPGNWGIPTLRTSLSLSTY